MEQLFPKYHFNDGEQYQKIWKILEILE